MNSIWWLRIKPTIEFSKEFESSSVSLRRRCRPTSLVTATRPPGTLPILFHEMRQEGRVGPGALVCFTAFGAGAHWGAVLYREPEAKPPTKELTQVGGDLGQAVGGSDHRAGGGHGRVVNESPGEIGSHGAKPTSLDRLEVEPDHGGRKIVVSHPDPVLSLETQSRDLAMQDQARVPDRWRQTRLSARPAAATALLGSRNGVDIPHQVGDHRRQLFLDRADAIRSSRSRKYS